MNSETQYIKILGTEYKIEFKTSAEDRMLQECDGYCDPSSKRIVITTENSDLDNFEDKQKEYLRHEIIHAFMFESGLGANWEHKPIGHEETTVDWMAIQFPKILQVFEKVGAL